MTRSFHRVLAFATVAVLAACSTSASNPGIPPAESGSSQTASIATLAGIAGEEGMAGAPVPPLPGAWALERACARPANPRDRYCLAIRRADLVTTDLAPNTAPQGYSPADLRSAYGLTSLSVTKGAGQTIAIVDYTDDPNAEADLAVYRSTYGLPACGSANGCFRKLNANGAASPLPFSDQGWAVEVSLDLDMASAMCPNCHLMLLEAGNASNSLDTAVNSAARLGANVISNSYGGGEYTKDDPAFDHPGVVITASAGDDNYYDCDDGCTGPEQPASFKGVVAVGGTSLSRNSSTRGWSEKVWNNDPIYGGMYGGTGSGCSRLVAKPSWQTDKGCPTRSETDVSAVADPQTGVAFYDTFAPKRDRGWGVVGGTSVSAPLVAGVFALAGNAKTVAQPQGLWLNRGRGTNDVTVGNNLVPTSIYPKAKSCPAAWRYICYAGPGYDGPTGWGTPNGISAF